MEQKNCARHMTPMERILSALPSLTKKQTKVANYLLEHFDEVTFFTLAELSTKCGVSEASIIRLTLALGYTGFSDMQRDLQGYIRSKISLSKRLDLVTNLGTDSRSIMRTVMQKEIEGLHRTMLGIDGENFERAVELLARAERIFMFGSRSSYSLIHFFALELQWIRDNVYALNTESPEFDVLSNLREGDVFFSISMPRYLRTTTKAMSLVHNNGHIPTIAITDSLTSPLMPYTTVPLLVDNEIFSYCDNAVPIIATITALLNAIGSVTSPTSNKILARNEKTWEHFDLYLR